MNYAQPYTLICNLEVNKFLKKTVNVKSVKYNRMSTSIEKKVLTLLRHQVHEAKSIHNFGIMNVIRKNAIVYIYIHMHTYICDYNLNIFTQTMFCTA